MAILSSVTSVAEDISKIRDYELYHEMQMHYEELHFELDKLWLQITLGKLSDDEENAVLKAARVMGLGVCGVDLLQSKSGPLILEVNSSPGLEGIESATGKDIAKSVIRYVERNV